MRAYSTLGGEIYIELNSLELPLNGRLKIRTSEGSIDAQIEILRYTGNQFMVLETFPEESEITDVTLFRVSLSNEAYQELRRRNYVGERFNWGWKVDINLD